MYGFNHPREQRTFSLAKALLALHDEKPLKGYEAEVDQEMRRHHQATSNNSVLIPTAVPLRQRRDLTAAGTSAIVGTDLLAGNFIDLLRNRLVSVKLGARIIGGLRGNVAIPKQTAAGTAHWLTSEATAIPESTQTFSQITMTPKNVGAYTEFSRQLLLQSTPGVDEIVTNDLAKVIGLAIDTAILIGTGASGQPTGLLNTAGIGSFAGTDLDAAGLADAVADVAASNALNESLGWLTTPAVAALLAQRHKASNTYSPLWEGNILDGTVSGYRAMSSHQCPASTMVLGAWDEILIGEWGFLEIASNPYANFAGGIIGIRAMQTVDVGIRHPEAFSVATSIT
jgi:HK97 family phage major capsid protein